MSMSFDNDNDHNRKNENHQINEDKNDIDYITFKKSNRKIIYRSCYQ